MHTLNFPNSALSVEEWTDLASVAVSITLVAAACVRVPRLAALPRIDRTYHPRSWATRVKFTALFLAIGLSANLLFQQVLAIKFGLSATVSAFAQAVAAIAALWLHAAQHRHSIYTSDILIVFWPASCAVAAMSVRNGYRSGILPGDWHVQWALAAYFVIAATVFCLELLVTPPEHYFRLAGDGERYDPRAHANIYARLTYTWVRPALELGYKTQSFSMGDMYPVNKECRGQTAATEFFKTWDLEQQKPNPSFLRALSKAELHHFMEGGIYLAASTLAFLLQPLVLKRVIVFLQTYGTNEGSSIEYGVFLAVCMAVPAVVKALMFQMYWFALMFVYMYLHRVLAATIFRKALTISNEARGHHSAGEIVSYLSVDADRVAVFIHYMHDFWNLPLQIIVIIYLLYTTIGWSCLVGLALVLISTYVNIRFADKVGDSTKQFMHQRDQRMRVVAEMFNNIKAIKLYAWERAFVDKIEDIRNTKELKALRQMGIWNSMVSLVSSLTPVLITLATFATYAVFGNDSHGPLTSQLIFVSLTLFFMIQEPISQAPPIISMAAGVIQSYKRIDRFVLSTDRDPLAVENVEYDRYAKTSTVDDVLVEVSDGSFKWHPDEDNIITDINIKCGREELVAVIGKVGSGKSSVISALLGDMVKSSGSVTVRGSVALVPQQPWIINATLRDNILFGKKFDQAFYDKVLDACALRADIEMLAGGDMTEIGEKGINLSGGQKARISLARAVYSRADVYLLDDPLSAVDAHVGKHIFNHVLGPSGLLKTRSRVLATNALQYLSGADQIVMLSGGKTIEQGTFAQLAELKGEAFEFIEEFVADPTNPTSPDDSEGDESGSVSRLDSDTSLEDTQELIRRHTLGRASIDTQMYDINMQTRNTAEHVIIRDERQHVGAVGFGPVMHYIRACGTRNIVMLVIISMITLLFLVGSSLWLAYWTKVNENSGGDSASNALYYLSIYSLLGLAGVLSMMAVWGLLWLVCAVNGAKNTHAQMLQSVLHAPMSFFDSTPMGRVLGLFSSDQSQIDEYIPTFFGLWLNSFLRLTIALTLIVAAVPLSLLFILPVAYVFILIQRLYMPTSREIRRILNTMRNSVITSTEEAVQGATTIRAYGRGASFEQGCAMRSEMFVMTFWTYLCMNRWIACRLDLLAAFIIFSTTILLLVALYFVGSLNSGYASLSLTYAITMVGVLNTCVRATAIIEIAMISVERAKDYSGLDSEAPEVIQDNRPTEDWPEQGVVEFRNYSTRYREGLDLVLKDLSFRVQPKQKVGIVGRTGAGKSSLTLALFRIIEAASGQILIDGEDISKYGLFDLRSRLSIIPQDPVLFAGTIRENLDPFGKYSDDEIWRALDHSHLGDTVRSKNERLEFVVAQGGENFSVGQRQLICLARALLKRAKVLVLDEATAAIDNSTDAVIQQTIREEFKECTVLTIAHRLNTIIDSDMVLVVDKGHVAEFDSPQNLLAKNSLFAKLVEESKNSDSS